MILVAVSYKLPPGKREGFLQELKEAGIVDACRAEEGNIRYDYFYPEDGTEDWCFLWFGYTGGNYKEMTRYMLKINGPVFSLSAEDVFLSKLNMLRRSSSVRLNVFQAASLVHELFGALKNKLDQDHFSTIPEPVRHTIHRIQTEQIMPRVAELAEELGVSREYLSRIFHRAMSCSLQSFLKECCDEKAKKLLVTTDLSVTEIARLCGYQSESSFIRMFREKNQISPEKFRIITLQSYLSNSGQEQKQ